MHTPVKGLVTLIVFSEGEEPLGAFEGVLQKHNYSNLKSFHMNCHGRQGAWLERIMSCCLRLDEEEVGVRVRGCKTRCVATAVCLIGSRRQVILFPSEFELVCALMRGRGRREAGGRVVPKGSVGRRLGSTLGYETESSEDEKEDHLCVDKDHSHRLHPPDSVDEYDRSALVHQVTSGFVTWLERLADGSLSRYSIEEWPEWTEGT